jgi:hypothetical protein
MTNRQRFSLFIAFVIAAATFAQFHSVHAASPSVTYTPTYIGGCGTGGYYVEAVLNVTGAPFVVDVTRTMVGQYTDVFTDSFSTDVIDYPVFLGASGLASTLPYTVTTVIRYNGEILESFTITCDENGQTIFTKGIVELGNSDSPTFRGPPLPIPSERNLVLVITDVPVDASRVIRTCQTVFLQTKQENRVYFFNIILPEGSYIDVAEDYGQPNGEPIYPACVGR